MLKPAIESLIVSGGSGYGINAEKVKIKPQISGEILL